MADEEHKAAGHIKDSTGSWVDPKDYVDTYYMDWLKNQYDRQREEK